MPVVLLTFSGGLTLEVERGFTREGIFARGSKESCHMLNDYRSNYALFVWALSQVYLISLRFTSQKVIIGFLP